MSGYQIWYDIGTKLGTNSGKSKTITRSSLKVILNTVCGYNMNRFSNDYETFMVRLPIEP